MTADGHEPPAARLDTESSAAKGIGTDWGWLGLNDRQRLWLLFALVTVAVAVTAQNLPFVRFRFLFLTVRLPGALLLWASALCGGAVTFLLLAVSATREDLRAERRRWRS